MSRICSSSILVSSMKLSMAFVMMSRGGYSTDTSVCESLTSGRAAAVRPQRIGCSHLHISISGNVFMISVRSMPEVSVHH